ncbi:MAG: hypothetical protein ACRDPD_02715 [Streptosporangiaceae bacterium]
MIALIALAVLADNAEAIGHAAGEAVRVLVLVAIAGGSLALAAGTVVIALAVRRGRQPIGRGPGQLLRTLPGPARRELAEPRADIPAEVWIHPPRQRSGVIR